MSKLYYILFLLLMSCSLSENKDTLEAISINPYEATELKLSEIVDTIEYIKLESNKDILLSNSCEFFLSKNYIYILDNSQDIIYLFNINGSYISKLSKKGYGPEEYATASEILVDENEEYIEVFDFIRKKIIKYSNISFDWIETVDLEERVIFDAVKKVKDMYYLYTNKNDNLFQKNPTNADLLLLKNGKVENVFFDDRAKRTEGDVTVHFAMYNNSLVLNRNGELFVSTQYDNKFYKIDGDKVIPIYEVDFQGHGINNEIRKLSTFAQKKFYESNLFLGKASYPCMAINNEDIMSFVYLFKTNENVHYKEKSHQYILLKKSNKAFLANKIINDISYFPKEVDLFPGLRKNGISYSHLSYHRNYLIDVISPYYELQKINVDSVNYKDIGKIKVDDNPIIILMKLKDNTKADITRFESEICRQMGEVKVTFHKDLTKDSLDNLITRLNKIGINLSFNELAYSSNDKIMFCKPTVECRGCKTKGQRKFINSYFENNLRTGGFYIDHESSPYFLLGPNIF